MLFKTTDIISPTQRGGEEIEIKKKRGVTKAKGATENFTVLEVFRQ